MRMPHWSLEQVNLERVNWVEFDSEAVKAPEVNVVRLVAVALTLADPCRKNLLEVGKQEPLFQTWVENWFAEQTQLARVLRRWLALADPKFDYEKSVETYGRIFEPHLAWPRRTNRQRFGQELMIRLSVISGLSSFLTALADQTAEPTLRQICHLTVADQIHHYQFLQGALARLEGPRRPSRLRRFRLLWMRWSEVGDAELALAYACAMDPEHASVERVPLYSREALALGLSFFQEKHYVMACRLAIKAVGLKRPISLPKWLGYWAFRLVQRRLSRITHQAHKTMHALLRPV